MVNPVYVAKPEPACEFRITVTFSSLLVIAGLLPSASAAWIAASSSSPCK